LLVCGLRRFTATPEIPAFYGTEIFTAVETTATHWYVPWGRWTHSPA